MKVISVQKSNEKLLFNNNKIVICKQKQLLNIIFVKIIRNLTHSLTVDYYYTECNLFYKL